ncbi:MAG: thermonuclease family protein [Hyphomicrobiaceae bacterium]|nr:thermonuclease family protein [Hyphomicrobiaceae bacterium]
MFENERITFTGGAEPIDGDTFWLGIHKIRLKGIEALEIGQTCTKDGKPYDCIDRTFDEIKRVTSGDKVRCQVERGNFGKPAMDRNRYLAICYSGEADIGRAMVTAGWALATDDLYQTDEAEAKRGKRGLHATEFVIPAEFRKSKRGESECDEMERRCVKPKVGSPSSRKPLD